MSLNTSVLREAAAPQLQYEYQNWTSDFNNISQSPQPRAAARKPHQNQVMPDESTHFRDVDDFYPFQPECSQFASNAACSSDAAFTAARPRF